MVARAERRATGWAESAAADFNGVVIDLRADAPASSLQGRAMNALLELHRRAAADGDWPLAQTAATAYRLLAGGSI